MKLHRHQFGECKEQGFLEKNIFKSFKDHPEMLPAFPNQKMQTALESGEWSGITIFECGRFGGECSSGHPDCRKMRNIV